MAVQSKLELVVADRLVGLNALPQLLQSQEQAEVLRFGWFQVWQHRDDDLKYGAASVRITIGLVLQAPRHNNQPTFEPAGPDAVFAD